MKKLIITEGNDDQKFFEGLLDFLDIKNINVISINPKRGSKINIFTINDIQQTITRSVEELEAKILITCDADFEANNDYLDGFIKTREQSLKTLQELKSKEENQNKNIEFFILPNNEKDGNLESLFLDSLFDKSVIQCVDEYHNCLSKKISFKINSKTKAMSLLTAIGSGDIYKAGFAAKEKLYWNFESEALKPLTNYLKDFFK
jgi:hypothetical protein